MMITESIQIFMRRDVLKGLFSMALFALSLSRANFGSVDPISALSSNASQVEMIQTSENIKEIELWEQVFATADNTASLLCAACSGVLLIMTLLKKKNRVKQLLTSVMMLCLMLAILSVAISDLASWAAGHRFKMISAPCYICMSAAIYIFNIFR